MSQAQVRLPQMREEIIAAVRALSDPDHQRHVWIERRYPHPDYYDDLTLNLNVLYDDTLVLKDPDAAIETTLRDTAEAQKMQQLANRLDEILNTLGPAEGDATYSNNLLYGFKRLACARPSAARPSAGPTLLMAR